jgi:predicted aspartyl protease
LQKHIWKIKMRLLAPALLAALMVSATLSSIPVRAQHAAPASSADDDHDPPPPRIAAAETATVPFELFRGNRVAVAAKVNGHGTQAMLDSGASATTLDRAFARSINLPKGQPIAAHGASGVVDAELVSGVTLEIGGMRFENMNVAVMDLSPVAAQLGRPLPLVVGRELFNTAAIEFGWAEKRLTITPSSKYAPPAGSSVLPLERRGPFNFVKLSVAGLPTIDALLDLGSGGNLKLPSDYWSKHPVLANLPYADSQGGGVGGVHTTRAVTLPAVEFAGKRFEQVPGILGGDSQGNQPQYGTNLGIGFLKQFDLTLDLGRDRIVLKPLANPPGFDRDRAGVRVITQGSVLEVAFVAPQGPAAKAGLKAGDKIVAIDGRPIGADFFASADGRWNLAAAGTPVTLSVEGGRTVKFALADFY